MKILAAADELDPHGGQERSLLEVTERLAERGHAVHLLYRRPGAFTDRYRSFCASMHRIGTYRGEGSPWRRRATLVASAAAAHRHAAGVDAVYLNDDRHTFFGGLLARLPSRPLVCHLRLPVTAARTRQDRYGLPWVDRFIAISEHTRRAFVSDGLDADKVDVVHNGIDPADFPPAGQAERRQARAALGLGQADYVVLYAGRLDEAKGIETALDAWNLLDLPDATFVLAGAPRNHRTPAEGAAYAAGLRARDRTGTTRWLDRQNDVVPLYHAADVVVLPSVFEEPFGRVLVEAMACGRPIVGTRVGGIPEVLGGTFDRFLVPPNDPTALAGVLRGMRGWHVEDPDLAARCRAHVEANFTLDRTADGVEAVLERAIAGRARGH